MNALIVEHTEMAARVAQGMARRCPQGLRDDLVSAGYVGLTEAARRWDGISPFVPFALQRIRGAVLDEMRRGDIMSRKTRQTARKVASAIKKLDGDVTDEKVAEQLGVTEIEYRNTLAVLAQFKVDSLDADGAPTLSSTQDTPVDQIERNQLIAKVRAALAELDKRDATLLGLRYIEEMTCDEIGLTLEISAGRVCQLLKRAVARLRNILSDECVEYAH